MKEGNSGTLASSRFFEARKRPASFLGRFGRSKDFRRRRAVAEGNLCPPRSAVDLAGRAHGVEGFAGDAVGHP